MTPGLGRMFVRPAHFVKYLFFLLLPLGPGFRASEGRLSASASLIWAGANKQNKWR